MKITGTGWEIHIKRTVEQVRKSDGKRRTVGSYQVYHDGTPQTGAGLSGTVAETRGPGANRPVGNGRRIQEGRYPLFTQDGEKYVTLDYQESNATNARPKPGLLVEETGDRIGIVIHPGQGFLSSVGCFNPCTSLPNPEEPIDYVGSRKRVIAIIEDLKRWAGTKFPKENGNRIPKAWIVIEGEPTI